MVIIEQHGHDLTLRRGEQLIVLPAASAAQRLAAVLAQLGVTATPAAQADAAQAVATPAPHVHTEEHDDT